MVTPRRGNLNGINILPSDPATYNPEERTQTAFLEEFYDFFSRNQDKEELVLYGGSGGGKSHSVCQYIVNLALTYPGIDILVMRKTLPSLKKTTFKMIISILREEGWVDGKDYFLNRSDLTIITYIGSTIWFGSAGVSGDDVEKYKSSSYNVVYVEEITEFSYEEYLMLKNTIRAKPVLTLKNKMVMTFNPIDYYHWVWQKVVLTSEEWRAIHHSTHWNNPFLPFEYHRQLEDLINKDINFYRVYCLGEPGVLQNVIYSDYEIRSWNYPYDALGMDFGFNNPTAVIAITVRDEGYYVKELLYERRMTNKDLIGWMNLTLPYEQRDIEIYPDPAEPNRIQEIREHGFNIYEAKKSVKDGIDFVKSKHLIIDPSSTNLLSELRSYKYKENVKTGEVFDEPVKFMDHAMDAMRYVIYTYVAGRVEPDQENISFGKHVDMGKSMSFGGRGIPGL